VVEVVFDILGIFVIVVSRHGDARMWIPASLAQPAWAMRTPLALAHGSLWNQIMQVAMQAPAKTEFGPSAWTTARSGRPGAGQQRSLRPRHRA
ncbi:MAG TPA: hypothetical protein VM687_08305, partial [Stenotrophomonas sp.]|nr:hypothetical protein [Stenotrophomonas sp.]